MEWGCIVMEIYISLIYIKVESLLNCLLAIWVYFLCDIL